MTKFRHEQILLFNFDENNLDELETGMVPVESVHIEHIQADGTITKISNLGRLGDNNC